jgi:hypothetical protein
VVGVDQKPSTQNPGRAPDLPLSKKRIPQKLRKVPQRSNPKPRDGRKHYDFYSRLSGISIERFWIEPA